MFLVSLLGEQPLANLMPLLHLKPVQTLLVRTERTAEVARRLGNVLADTCDVAVIQADAFDIAGTRQLLLNALCEARHAGQDMVFNLTGGTKAMCLAAYSLAEEWHTPFLYLQSDRQQMLLYHYIFSGGVAQLTDKEILPGLLTIPQYLLAHVDSYQVTGFSQEPHGGPFEQAVHDALQPVVDEILPGVRLSAALELDAVVRCGNQIALVEIKNTLPRKQGVDQLVAASGRECLGTYAVRIMVNSQDGSSVPNNRRYAADRNVQLIELPSFHDAGALSDADIGQLRLRVLQALGRKP